jgi:hypothetical protein
LREPSLQLWRKKRAERLRGRGNEKRLAERLFHREHLALAVHLHDFGNCSAGLVLAKAHAPESEVQFFERPVEAASAPAQLFSLVVDGR